ncbi:MAG: hypothetical protein CSB44_10205 [Gammaproteobacteria bacterium]|nr:MAG: hypothetical protein CSB44_10205 [Gammaproteobacteria bacterium]
MTSENESGQGDDSGIERLYLDTEFTGLTGDAALISLAITDEHGRAIYLERTGLASADQNPWLVEHVLSALWTPLDDDRVIEPEHDDTHHCTYGRGTPEQLGRWLRDWLAPFARAEVWVDMGSWDWVLFVSLFGSALSLPKNLEMYPVELSTWLRARALPFDLDRESLAPFDGHRHHALDDARHLRAVVGVLLSRSPEDAACVVRG